MTLSIPLFLSEPHACNYLPNELASSVFVHPYYEIDNSVYSKLIAMGYRRSGRYVYKPNCQHCHQCIPVRLDVANFKPKRHQKRSLTKNSITEAIVKPARFDSEHYALYQRYQNSRHRGGGMSDSSPEEFMEFLTSSWSNTVFVEFRANNHLFSVAVVDQLNDALSAVYTYFDPEYSSYSPGNYAVLWQIEWAKELGLRWLYLGYWIEQCQKMNYKSRYQPLQYFVNKEWHDSFHSEFLKSDSSAMPR